MPCLTGCLSCLSESVCLSCPLGTYNDGAGVCVGCGDNCGKCHFEDGGVQCRACLGGYYLNSGGQCAPCG